MKVLLEEKDIKYIDNINADLKDGKRIPLFINNVDGEYYVKFKCDDIAKANAFIMGLVMDQNNKENEENLGVTFLSVNYCHGDDKIASLKSKLLGFIDELDNMQ